MAETKEEKATRLALEAEAKKNEQPPADDESAKQIDEAVETIPSHLVSVELNDASESVLKNTHTIFHAKGSTEFVDGVANVNADVAAHLKESGQVK